MVPTEEKQQQRSKSSTHRPAVSSRLPSSFVLSKKSFIYFFFFKEREREKKKKKKKSARQRQGSRLTGDVRCTGSATLRCLIVRQIAVMSVLPSTRRDTDHTIVTPVMISTDTYGLSFHTGRDSGSQAARG